MGINAITGKLNLCFLHCEIHRYKWRNKKMQKVNNLYCRIQQFLHQLIVIAFNTNCEAISEKLTKITLALEKCHLIFPPLPCEIKLESLFQLNFLLSTIFLLLFYWNDLLLKYMERFGSSCLIWDAKLIQAHTERSMRILKLTKSSYFIHWASLVGLKLKQHRFIKW